MATIGKQELLQLSNDSKDALTLLIIKPEPLADGRASRIQARVERFCDDNDLIITSSFRLKMKESDIHAHFAGSKKLEETGKKVLGAMRMAPPDKRRLAEEAGLTLLSPEDLGKMVRDIELSNYVGKEMNMLLIYGPNALSKIRAIRGASDPSVSGPNTIRREFSSGMGIIDILLNKKPLDNIVHVPLNYDELDEELKRLIGKSAKDVFTEAKMIALRR